MTYGQPAALSSCLSTPGKRTDALDPFGSTTAQESSKIPTSVDSDLCAPSPDLQEQDYPLGKDMDAIHTTGSCNDLIIFTDIQPCTSVDKSSVINQSCSSPANDNHDMNLCSTPSRYMPQNDRTEKAIGEQENNRNVLGDVSLQPKQPVSRPALSEGELLLNDRRSPSIAVIKSCSEDQYCLESDQSRSVESKGSFNRQIAKVALSAIERPPRRKAFEVAQTRIVEQRNQRSHDGQLGLDAIPVPRPNCSGTEESPRLAKRRKHSIRSAKKVTHHASSRRSGRSLRSTASARSAGSCSSQDIFGHAILTIETHASGTSYFFSFEPNSLKKSKARRFRFSLDDEPRRVAGLSPTDGPKKDVGRSRQGKPSSRTHIPTKAPCNTIDEQEWEVERILASRISKGKLQYQVQWKGCDTDFTWYPAHGFKGAPYKIQNFHGMFSDQPGPPKRLTEWLEAWEAGQELDDVPDDDLPE